MSRLSDLINEAVGEALQAGEFIVHDVVKAVTPRLDDEDRDVLVLEAVAARISAASKRTRKAILEGGPAETQSELFFGLPTAVAIDEHKIKLTRDLTAIDLRRVIKIRRAGIADDLKSVERWEAARDATAPILQAHPDWSFGEALDAAMAAASSAA